MRRRTLTAVLVSIALLLTIGPSPWSVISANAPVLITPEGGSKEPEKPKKEDDGIGTVLGAPFRALNKLFGGGKKPNRQTVITDKDLARFETSKVTRVDDARSPTTAAPDSVTAETGPPKPNSEANASDHLQKGRERLNAGRLNEAIAELSVAASLNPKDGEAHTLLGVAYDRKGLRDRALQSFETALHDPDDEAMHLNNLGYLHYKQGDYDSAIKYLKRAVKINPSDLRMWNNLAKAQIDAEKFEDARKSLAHTIGEFESHVKIARMFEHHGIAKNAIKHWEKARALRPDSAEVLVRLVILYEIVGKMEKAGIARASLSSLREVADTAAQ